MLFQLRHFGIIEICKKQTGPMFDLITHCKPDMLLTPIISIANRNPST